MGEEAVWFGQSWKFTITMKSARFYSRKVQTGVVIGPLCSLHSELNQTTKLNNWFALVEFSANSHT